MEERRAGVRRFLADDEGAREDPSGRGGDRPLGTEIRRRDEVIRAGSLAVMSVLERLR